MKNYDTPEYDRYMEQRADDAAGMLAAAGIEPEPDIVWDLISNLAYMRPDLDFGPDEIVKAWQEFAFDGMI